MFNSSEKAGSKDNLKRPDSSTYAGAGPRLTIQSPLFKRHGEKISSGSAPGTLTMGVEKRPQVWKKIAEAHAGHQEFLEKLGIVEHTVIKSRFLDPEINLASNSPKTPKSNKGNNPEGSKTKGHTIPWRKKDPAGNLVQEKQKIFENFNRISGEPPKTPPTHHPHPDTSAKRHTPSQKTTSQKEKKTLTFNDDLLEYHKPHSQGPPGSDPYANASPKIDTGLSQLRKTQGKLGGHETEKHTHHPLTIGPRLPHGFGFNFNYDTIRTNRQVTIDNVTARLYKNEIGGVTSGPAPSGRPPKGGDLLTSQQQRRSAQALDYYYHNNRPPTAFNKEGQKVNKYNPTYDATHMDEYVASSRAQGPLYSNHRGSNPIQILRAPVPLNSGTSTTYYQSHPMVNSHPPPPSNSQHSKNASAGGGGSSGTAPGTSSRGNNGGVGGGADRTTTPSSTQKRYRPSQLLPLHIPGPKYDNIYIGPYSGSESDRDDEDNMDRPVKSRKR